MTTAYKQQRNLLGWATAMVLVIVLSKVRVVDGDVLDAAVHGVLRDLFVCGEEAAMPTYNLTQMSLYL